MFSFLTLSSKILSFHKICFHFLFKIYYSFALEEAENVLSPNCFRAECLQARHLAFETDTMTFTGVNSFRPGCLVRWREVAWCLHAVMETKKCRMWELSHRRYVSIWGEDNNSNSSVSSFRLLLSLIIAFIWRCSLLSSRLTAHMLHVILNEWMICCLELRRKLFSF